MSQTTSTEGQKGQKHDGPKSETKVSSTSKSDIRMQAPKTSVTSIVIAGIITLVLVVIGQLTNISISQTTNSLAPIDSTQIMKHVNTLIDLGNSEFVYEKSRAKAREYIRDSLVEGGFPPDQILWHRFEWSEKKPQGRNITTTTWTGINIVVWTNSTEVPLTEGKPKIRVFGAHYDTNNWGENRTSGAHNNLAGTSLLIELAKQVYNQQKANKDETPYMFVFFDHKEPGSLGSKTFVDYYKIAKHVHQIAYFVNVDSIGYHGASPIVQTYPYEDKGVTIFTPKWLAHTMVQSAYAAVDDGMNVGHQSLGQSIRYQAFRYHLISVPLLADEGPFVWAGVPSLLFTDFDVFFDKNPDYNQPTDLPQNLDTDALQKAANILSQFVVATKEVLPEISAPTSVGPFYRFFSTLARAVVTSLGVDQYLIVGPFSLGFLELASLSLFMIFVIFQVSFASYRALCKSFINKPGHAYLTYLNHRVLFFHFVALVIAVFLDTVYAFIVILIAFPALLCISNRRLNLVVAIVCCIALADFVMLSLVYTVDYGRKGPKSRELRLWFLTAIYIAHTFLVLAYAGDSYIKNKLKPKQE